MKTTNVVLTIILIIVFLGFLGAGGYFVYQWGWADAMGASGAESVGFSGSLITTLVILFAMLAFSAGIFRLVRILLFRSFMGTEAAKNWMKHPRSFFRKPHFSRHFHRAHGCHWNHSHHCSDMDECEEAYYHGKRKGNHEDHRKYSDEEEAEQES